MKALLADMVVHGASGHAAWGENPAHGETVVLEGIASGQPLPDILALLLRTTEQQCAGMIGSILALEDGKLRARTPNRLPDFYNDAIDELEIGEGVGSCGTAAFRGELVIVENIPEHPFWRPFLPLITEAGLAACWSLPIKDATGQVLGTFALYYRDVRSPTDMELAVARRAAHLAAIAMVKHRTESALINSKEAAEAANHAKSVFLAQMSHELRTPLNAIIGFSDMMRQQVLGPLPDRYREYAGYVGDSGQHLLRIIDDVLDLAKVEAGEIRLHEAAVDLGKLISDTAALVRPPGQDAKVHLAVRVEPDLPPLMGDELRIKQILLNLLSNALKFTEDGLVIARADLVDGRICLSVEDSGKGMNEADIEVALLPFGQVESEMMTNPSQGTGLGLPLTRSLAELHQAVLVIDSNKGQGTRVIITFPQERTMALADQTSATA